MYDPALARFMTLDPLAEKYSFQSPYVYANNNPIYYIDENGEGAKTTIVEEEDEEGNVTKKAVVEATIYIYKPEGDETDLNEFAGTLQESLNSQFNEGDPTLKVIDPDTKKKTEMSAEFKFTVVALEGSPEEIADKASSNDKMSNNYYMVYQGSEDGINSHSQGGNSGVLQANQHPNSWTHEIMHNFGWKASGGSYGGHSDSPNSIMNSSLSNVKNAKIKQSDMYKLNGGAPAFNKGGFGYGKRNYIYSNPYGKPINNKYPNVSVYGN